MGVLHNNVTPKHIFLDSSFYPSDKEADLPNPDEEVQWELSEGQFLQCASDTGQIISLPKT